MTANETQVNRAPLETKVRATSPLVFPPAAKYEITYTKANGETVEYVMSNPIEEDADSFTAYVFGRGVRTFIKSRVSKLSQVS